jgi:hypothetical protein
MLLESKYKMKGLKEAWSIINKLALAKSEAERLMNTSEKKRFYGWLKAIELFKKFFGIKNK